jgi:ribosomal protein S27E
MQLDLLEPFEIPLATFTPRSQLVSLAPQGLNSARCEALISYLTRLAAAHVVRPNVLVKEIIIPLTEINLDTSSCNFNSSYSRTINSYTKYATTFTGVIEKLTLKENLKYLTFLPWGKLLDPKGSRLLRDHVGICPECLDELDKTETGIYYPLIWYMRAARICSKHNRVLRESCSTCGKYQNFVAHHAMLGYCTHCGAWLGTPTGKMVMPNEAATISDRDRFMTYALEQMIGNNSIAEQFASHERFVERIELYCQALTNGNMKRFEIRLGFKKDVVVNWADKRSRPRIDLFLELCFRLGQMPIQLLSAEIPKDILDHIGHFEKTSANRLRKLSQEQFAAMKTQLEVILAGPDSPTQLAVAAMLGVKRRFLNHHFAELARAISDKHKQAVAILTVAKRASKTKRARAVITKIFDEHRPISRRKIWAALENEGLTFADPKTRHTVREVIEEHHHQICSISLKTEDS